MKKLLMDETGNKLKITSNMKRIEFKSFEDFSEKLQAEILINFDYLPNHEILENNYIDEYYSSNDVLVLNSPWTQTSDLLSDELQAMVNNEYDNLAVGFIASGYDRDYYAIDSECYIKLHVNYVA